MSDTIIAILVIDALVCAVFSAKIASSKGRDGGPWFIAGLLFGIFALIAAAGISKEEPQSNTTGSGEMWKCPTCGNMNEWRFELCQSVLLGKPGIKMLCSTKRSASAKRVQLYVATEKKCPMCAETVKIEAKICRFCNHKFEEVAPAIDPLSTH